MVKMTRILKTQLMQKLDYSLVQGCTWVFSVEVLTQTPRTPVVVKLRLTQVAFYFWLVNWTVSKFVCFLLPVLLPVLLIYFLFYFLFYFLTSCFTFYFTLLTFNDFKADYHFNIVCFNVSQITVFFFYVKNIELPLCTKWAKNKTFYFRFNFFTSGFTSFLLPYFICYFPSFFTSLFRFYVFTSGFTFYFRFYFQFYVVVVF